MSLQVDVVIPTRDRERRLRRVIAPLLADAIVGRVIVVDDAAQPGVRAAEIADDPTRVELVATGGVGPALARQAGAERAGAELLLFLDDDVVPAAGLAAGHAHRHADGTPLLACGYTPVVAAPGRRLSGEAEVYGRIYEDRCRQYDDDPHVVLTHLWGGNFSLRREDALRIGLASAHFTQTYHEDRDFGLRCLEAGLVAVFDRALRAEHEYERGWPQTARESYCRGYSVVLLHHLHREVIGPFDERQFERDLPRPLASLVHESARSGVGRVTSAALHALRRLGAGLRVRAVELGAVRLLRRIEAAHGARDALETISRHVPVADG